jgi:hypothetical protein
MVGNPKWYRLRYRWARTTAMQPNKMCRVHIDDRSNQRSCKLSFECFGSNISTKLAKCRPTEGNENNMKLEEFSDD